ncbi:Retrovirus-related Pol polyprotein from transposon TNT 1-94 [Araneus ventricosus]|uniref:Retrovirus-related Pol polyprotein from transposon TNT 1-94 n=1 Tax=Araneus ventricosus TaxID=182803 RepID=A0A4Y2T2N9_ARAVE|nr:Retrovirus-related Pol polyprotein from transposon TNT 1-94 [Araneus ventricosus]
MAPEGDLIPGNGTLVMLDTFGSGNWIVCCCCWRQRMCGWDLSGSCGAIAGGSDMPFGTALQDLEIFGGEWGGWQGSETDGDIKINCISKTYFRKELGISVHLVNKPCESCINGKAHRLPFGTKKKASSPGELDSADVCGPFYYSFQKKCFLVAFKDSYTKFRYSFVIKEKIEVKDVLKIMLAHDKNLVHSVKKFLSDNGGEFDNKEVCAILSQEGITQRFTAPHTPEQNGASEREMSTIIEMARTLKYFATLWAELVTTAVYVLNRTGKSPVKGASPYERWMKKKPRLKHLRIISSICYDHVPVQKRKKMGKKAVKGYLVGYDDDERYRIWLKEENRVILSRDVIFQEKPSRCVQLMSKEPSNEGKHAEKKLDEKEQEPTSDTEDDSEENEQEIASDTVEENDEELQPSIDRQLRNPSLLPKPARFEDYILAAESFVYKSDSPRTFEEAINSKESVSWKKGMESEMASTRENQTWELTDLPAGSKALPYRWVFRIKTNPDGSINKYKTRLVVKGYSQRQGIDYSETYSPVAKLGTIRVILSIAAEEKMYLSQFYASTAFLYGELG